jgi:hypothetical protein
LSELFEFQSLYCPYLEHVVREESDAEDFSSVSRQGEDEFVFGKHFVEREHGVVRDEISIIL